jgi:hypothetical protein
MILHSIEISIEMEWEILFYINKQQVKEERNFLAPPSHTD